MLMFGSINEQDPERVRATVRFNNFLNKSLKQESQVVLQTRLKINNDAVKCKPVINLRGYTYVPDHSGTNDNRKERRLKIIRGFIKICLSCFAYAPFNH